MKPKILGYHRVNWADFDPHQLVVSPKNFRAQMQYLKDHRRVIPLSGMIGLINRGVRIDDDFVAITFDDGYADNFTIAYPILHELELPVTIFVVTAMVGSTEEFYWDQLEQLFPVHDFRFAKMYIDACIECRSFDKERRKIAMNSTITLSLKDIKSRPDRAILTAEQIKSMFDTGLINFGSHTINHLMLSVPEVDYETEIQESKDYLDNLLNTETILFSYPYGGPESFNQKNREALVCFGYLGAVTTIPGSITPGVDRFALPRLLVRDWGVEEFVRNLER